MPFDKSAKRADAVAPEIRGHSLAEYVEKELQINSFELEDTRTFGSMVHIQAQLENGKEVKLYSFSGVVIEQLGQLEPYLPVIVTVTKTGDYYTIF